MSMCWPCTTQEKSFWAWFLCRKTVRDTIIEKFAGPYDRGEYSPSVQKTLYDSQVLVLDRQPEVGHKQSLQHFFVKTLQSDAHCQFAVNTNEH